MVSKGWISIHRKILDNLIVTKDSDYFSVWIYLLLNATHSELEVDFNGELIKLKIGQLITGRKVISKQFNISESKVQRILKKLEFEHLIEQVTTAKGRLISIINYEKYQINERTIEQRVNNYRTTSEQLVNTNNNVNNANNNYIYNGENPVINNSELKPVSHEFETVKDYWKALKEWNLKNKE